MKCGPVWRCAYTVMELLLALFISAVALGLCLAATQHAREQANRHVCQQQLHQLVLAVQQYEAQNRYLPPYASGAAGELFGGWMVHLLPYTQLHDLFALITRHPLTGAYSAEAQATLYPFLLCPAEASVADKRERTNYVANWFALTDGTTGFYRPRQRYADMSDGLGSTVLFAEAHADCDGVPRLALLPNQQHNFGVTPTGKPSDDASYLPEDYTLFQARPAVCASWRTQSAHAAMNTAALDGSVHAVAADIASNVWKGLLKPRDGQPVAFPW